MTTAVQPALRKTRTGVVISDRMQKTIVVRISGLSRHATYGRVIGRAVSYKAHDEQQEAHMGDTVRIVETRPLSKDKHWRLVEILKRAPRQVAEVSDPLATEVTQPAKADKVQAG